MGCLFLIRYCSSLIKDISLLFHVEHFDVCFLGMFHVEQQNIINNQIHVFT
jgi:hypothetical protein